VLPQSVHKAFVLGDVRDTTPKAPVQKTEAFGVVQAGTTGRDG
jgi:hypothetical protein